MRHYFSTFVSKVNKETGDFSETKEDKVRCVEAQGKDEAKEIASRVGEGIIFKDEKMYLFGKEENGEIKVYQLQA